jgi:hypothetical protein
LPQSKARREVGFDEDLECVADRLRIFVAKGASRGIDLSTHQVAMREEIARAIDAAKAANAGALNVLASSLRSSGFWRAR